MPAGAIIQPAQQVSIAVNGANGPMAVLGNFGAPASAAWASANAAVFVPFRIGAPMIVQKLAWANGATLGGNVDIGIYDEAGTRIVSSGSIAQSGTNNLQEADITDTYLLPGLYFLAVACNSGTATLLIFTAASTQVPRMVGVLAQASAFPLPAVASLGTVSSAQVPLAAAFGRTTL